MNKTMIFLSASIPIKGREYYETANIPAIREAVMAFTKVCMDLKLPFYFGGHPAISPLVYQIAKEYGGSFATNVKIYQSMWFHGLTPPEVEYYQNIVWTDKKEDLNKSLLYMRTQMFTNPTDCAVFIGGMNDIIDEATMLHKVKPNIKLLPITNTGGACADLMKIADIKCDPFPVNDYSFAYTYLFKEYLKQFL